MEILKEKKKMFLIKVCLVLCFLLLFSWGLTQDKSDFCFGIRGFSEDIAEFRSYSTHKSSNEESESPSMRGRP